MSEREPTTKELLSWLKRAETIKRKAEALAFDVSGVTGFDHPLTDYVDNVVHMSEELCHAFNYHDPYPAQSHQTRGVER